MARRDPSPTLRELSNDAVDWINKVDCGTGWLWDALMGLEEWTRISALTRKLVNDDSPSAVGFVLGAFVRPLVELQVLELQPAGLDGLIRLSRKAAFLISDSSDC